MYIFESLVLSCPPHVTGRLDSDLLLGFQAAVAALGLKANVSEAEHPLLCEGTRRTRQELAIALLVQYKDDADKLEQIMDKLLDKEVHQMFKNGNTSRTSSVSQTPGQSSSAQTSSPSSAAPPCPKPSSPGKDSQESVPETLSASNSDQSLESKDVIGAVGGSPLVDPPPLSSSAETATAGPSKVSSSEVTAPNGESEEGWEKELQGLAGQVQVHEPEVSGQETQQGNGSDRLIRSGNNIK